jgi:hypothetical protein
VPQTPVLSYHIFFTATSLEFSQLSKVAFFWVVTAMVSRAFWSSVALLTSLLILQIDLLNLPGQILASPPTDNDPSLLADILTAITLFREKFPYIIPDDVGNDLEGCLRGITEYGKFLLLPPPVIPVLNPHPLETPSYDWTLLNPSWGVPPEGSGFPFEQMCGNARWVAFRASWIVWDKLQ